ncbi:MAG: glycosyltransferase family 2 protein [Bacteroidales bacterium]|nr:glycosyltransferase family 2 protein [Bacteroidales bacterium]
MISVIICTYNRDKYIYRVLESLAQGNCDRSSYEIVVIDNNCTDHTQDELQRFAQDFPDVCLRCFTETRQGLSHARNRGISEAQGDLLVYVDDDATVNGQYLQVYADFFEHHPEIDAAGGPIIPHYEDGAEPDWMTYFTRQLLTGYLYYGSEIREFPGGRYPGGGNAAYRRKVFDQVGLYNPDLGRKGQGLASGEEKDIFNKMKSAGMKFMYLPGAVLYHSIPHYKLEKEYFDKLTRSMGQSEKARTLQISRSEYLKRILQEVVKWAGTLVLWLYYMLTFRPQCGNKLIRFRWNLSSHLIG